MCAGRRTDDSMSEVTTDLTCVPMSLLPECGPSRCLCALRGSHLTGEDKAQSKAKKIKKSQINSGDFSLFLGGAHAPLNFNSSPLKNEV